MAQRQPDDKITVDQVLKLVDRLSSEERQELYRMLDLKSWGERWRRLYTKVDAQNKDLSPISEDEIVAEMKSIREELKAKRANGSN